MIKWDYSKGLPPLEKPFMELEMPIGEDDKIFKTDIDGFPYVILNSEEIKNLQSLNKTKFKLESENTLYTLKNLDLENLIMSAKVDKVLNITEQTVDKLKDHYLGWGLNKEADKVKVNYRFLWSEFCLSGKISKNQVIQYGSIFMKVSELEKEEDKTIRIIGEEVGHIEIFPVFPYREKGEIKAWYNDIQDVWVRQAREFKKGD